MSNQVGGQIGANAQRLAVSGMGTLGLVDRTHGVNRPRVTEPGHGVGVLELAIVTASSDGVNPSSPWDGL